MKTFAELKTEISTIIQDSSYTSTIVGTKINDGLYDVASKIFLPSLMTITTIDTTLSQNYTAFETTYHRNLFYCYSTTNNRRIKIYRNTALLFRQFSQIDLSGNVVGVAAEGPNLYYQRIPSSAETLQVRYYAKPTNMSDDADQPTELEDYAISRDLLVHYACREIFTQIEDGVDGQKVNTQYHDQKYKEALALLIQYIGPDALNPYREPQEFEDDLNLDWFLM